MHYHAHRLISSFAVISRRAAVIAAYLIRSSRIGRDQRLESCSGVDISDNMLVELWCSVSGKKLRKPWGGNWYGIMVIGDSAVLECCIESP